MAGGIARAATGGSGGQSMIDVLRQRIKDKAEQGGVAGAAQPGGIAGAIGSLANDGSTAGVAPAPITGAPVDPSGVDQFAGKKFEISPVQMKGSFSSKTRKNAEGVYGDEDKRNNSLKR